MSRQGGVSQWIAEVSSRFGVLTPAQTRVLAYWSYGMVLTQSCGLTTVATFLATLLGRGMTRSANSCANGAMMRRINAEKGDGRSM